LTITAVVGPHPALANVLFASGFSGHGIQHSPGVGRAVAELVIDGGYRSIDLSPLSFERVIAGRPPARKEHLLTARPR